MEGEGIFLYNLGRYCNTKQYRRNLFIKLYLKKVSFALKLESCFTLCMTKGKNTIGRT